MREHLITYAIGALAACGLAALAGWWVASMLAPILSL